jgi:hypothetical protein
LITVLEGRVDETRWSGNQVGEFTGMAGAAGRCQLLAGFVNFFLAAFDLVLDECPGARFRATFDIAGKNG